MKNKLVQVDGSGRQTLISPISNIADDNVSAHQSLAGVPTPGLFVDTHGSCALRFEVYGSGRVLSLSLSRNSTIQTPDNIRKWLQPPYQFSVKLGGYNLPIPLSERALQPLRASRRRVAPAAARPAHPSERLTLRKTRC